MNTDQPHPDLTDGQRRYVVSRAQQLGLSAEDYLRSLVPSADEQGAQNGPAEQSAYEVAQDLGLIGCVGGGPTDLATNPEHMEGFGRDQQDPGPH